MPLPIWYKKTRAYDLARKIFEKTGQYAVHVAAMRCLRRGATDKEIAGVLEALSVVVDAILAERKPVGQDFLFAYLEAGWRKSQTRQRGPGSQGTLRLGEIMRRAGEIKQER